MPQLDPSSFASQLFWLAVTFTLLYLLMSRLALPQVANILQNRKEKISNDLDEANRLTDEADSIEKHYEASMKSAREDANKMVNEAVANSKQEMAALQKKLDADIADKLAAAAKSMAKAKQQAEEEVGAVADTLSEIVVSKLTSISSGQAKPTNKRKMA